MALTTKRIIALPSQTDPQEGDYLAIDNATSGTHKIPVGRVGVEVDDTLTEAGKAADAKAVGDALDAIRSQAEATDDSIDEIRSQIEVTGTASGAIATFTDGADMPAKSVIVNIEPQQSGSGTPSPDNVRPISGWESVSVNVTGVNVWDEEWEQGDLNSTTGKEISSTSYIRSVNYTPCVPNTEYYGKANSKIWLYWYDKDKNFVSNTSGGFQNTTKTAPSTAHFFRLVQYASTYDNGTSINYPSTDTSYHAYNGHTTTTSLGRTVYGGTLDVVSGVLTVDRAMVDAGSCNWDYASAHDCFYTDTVRDDTKSAPILICSAYPYVGVYARLVDKSCAYIYANAICVRDSAYNQDPAAFKSAMSGVQLVYELATPTTYTLTPTEIQTLLGENNVWADAGDVEVVYVRDLNITINNLLNSNGTRSLGMMAMSAPTENTAEEPTDEQSDEQTEEPAEDDMR